MRAEVAGVAPGAFAGGPGAVAGVMREAAFGGATARRACVQLAGSVKEENVCHSRSRNHASQMARVVSFLGWCGWSARGAARCAVNTRARFRAMIE